MTPYPVATVPSAISSGTAAATGLRNTSSRTRISIGAAISSPLCSASIEAVFTSLPSDGIPARCARTGGRIRAATKSFIGPTTVLMLPPRGIWRSTSTTARLGLGRSAWSCFAVPLQGEMARVSGRRWSAVDEGRSLPVELPPRSDEQDDERLVEAPGTGVAPALGLGARDEQQRRLHLVFGVPADQPEDHDDDCPADEDRDGVPHGEASDRRDQVRRPSGVSIGARTTASPSMAFAPLKRPCARA